ncbi:MAG: hypothetical protein WC741_02790 [Patescibacteria group bacterium]|jgi:hypothetical protein
MPKEQRAETGRIDRLLERLQHQSLFSLKEFSSPLKIVEEANRLTRLRYVNHDGFLRETSDVFAGLSKNDDRNSVDPNKLTSIILTLQSPLDPSKWKPSNEILSYSTTRLQEALLGKNADFLTGKKESNFIIPAYLILRSLRERSSMWLTGTFLRLKKKQQEKLIIETDELKNKILSSINLPWVKEKVVELFNQTLDFNILKPEAEIIQKEEEKPLSNTVPASIYIKEFDRFADERLQPVNESAHETFSFIDAVSRFVNVDFTRGKINIPDRKIQKKIKADPDYKIFYGIFSTDYDQLATASTISILSSENDLPNSSWTKSSEEKKGHHQKIRNITNAFGNAFEEICTDNNVFNNLVDTYKKVISDEKVESFEGLNFGLLNQKLTALLYSHYPTTNKKEDPDMINLADFLEVPGVKESLLALKKALLIKMTKSGFSRSLKESNIYFENSDISTFMINHHDFLHQDGVSFYLKDLKKLRKDQLNINLAYLNISEYIQHKKIGVKLVEEKEDRFLVEIPDEMLPGFEEPISMNGYPVRLSLNTTRGEKMVGLKFSWKNVEVAILHAS